ncbi:MAG: hypothetical protein HYX41_01590 [Bdellovibrio sp.]|nr:hypothetical protein [Bdellovibrio sp.]
MRSVSIVLISLMVLLGALTPSYAENDSSEDSRDYSVYSVFQDINLTNDPATAPPKDYYINMGSKQGLRKGSILEVRRKVSSYDGMSEQFYRDLSLPFAKVRVIHVEPRASIARLEKLLPLKTSPMVSPRAVMIGDLVSTPAK